MPQHLDEPFKIILWTIDELIALACPIVLFMFIFDKPLIGLVLGGMCLFGLKKIKGEQGHYFLYHMIYWYLPNIFGLKKTPPSHIREWIG